MNNFLNKIALDLKLSGSILDLTGLEGELDFRLTK